MKVTAADDNVFADLGLADADELKAKAELVIQIIEIIEERGLKQAEFMGIDQPKVSQLVRGKLAGWVTRPEPPVSRSPALRDWRAASS